MMPRLRSCLVVSLLVVWLQGEAAAFKRTASPSLLITRPDKFNAPQPEQVHAQSSLPSAASHRSTTFVTITRDFVASLSLVAVMMFSTPDSICPHQLPGPLAPPAAPFFHTTAAAANLPESTGASTKNIGSPAALVPVVKLQRALAAVDPDGDLGLIQRQLAALPADEKKFKRVFDAYSEGISYKQQYLDKNAFLVYYTGGFDGPGRGSIEAETAGEARQKAQYGARNDAWVAVDEARAEAAYLAGPQGRGEGREDLRAAVAAARRALDAYLALAPPGQLEEAAEAAVAAPP